MGRADPSERGKGMLGSCGNRARGAGRAGGYRGLEYGKERRQREVSKVERKRKKNRLGWSDKKRDPTEEVPEQKSDRGPVQRQEGNSPPLAP